MRNDPPINARQMRRFARAVLRALRLARITSRFGDLPDLYTFECPACGVSHIEAADPQPSHHPVAIALDRRNIRAL
jgi:hypothetical protein